MKGDKKNTKFTAEQQVIYQELEEIYKKLYQEVAKLEAEGNILRRELKEIIDKAKMKNVLQDIIKQPD